jgi:hypothetical protein
MSWASRTLPPQEWQNRIVWRSDLEERLTVELEATGPKLAHVKDSSSTVLTDFQSWPMNKVSAARLKNYVVDKKVMIRHGDDVSAQQHGWTLRM